MTLLTFKNCMMQKDPKTKLKELEAFHYLTQ